MKKLLGVSLVAILAVSPMMAMAAGELNAAVTVASDHTGADAGIAATSYVEGAYNAALQQIRNVNSAVTTLNGNADQDGSVLHAIKGEAVHGTYAANGSYDDGTIGKAIQSIASTANAAVSSVVEGDTNGTIKVDGSAVSVHGLGTAAFTDSTAYDVAGAADSVASDLSSYMTSNDAVISGIEGDISTIQGDISTITSTYATQDGVKHTVDAATVTGNVTGSVTVYTNWNDATATDTAAIAATFSNGDISVDAYHPSAVTGG